MKIRLYILIINCLFATIAGNAQTVASFIVQPSVAGCSVIMTFDASSSTVSSGHNIAKYEWDFDYDGVTFDIQASGVVVEHSYSRMKGTGSGELFTVLPYTVALRVTDDNDPAEIDIATNNATLSFSNSAPIADAGGPYYATRVNDAVTSVILNGTNSIDYDSPCDEVVTYKWDTDGDGLFGSDDTDGGICNGSECEGETITILDNNWNLGSSIPINLQVVDSYGLVSPVASTVVQVVSLSSVPPTINDIIFDELVSGDAFIELKVSHPEESPQTFDCSFYLMPEGIELTVYDGDSLRTQIDYVGDNVNQSVIRYFNTTPFLDRIDFYQLKVVITMSDNRQSEKVTRPFSIDNTPPANPSICIDLGSINGVCTNDDDPCFTWSGASDNYSNVLEYYYYWGTDPSGISETNLVTSNGYNPDPLMADGIYYLRINTIDEAGNEAGWTTLYTYKYFDYKHIDTYTICDGDSLLWHEVYYKTAGTHYDSLTAINGCDSIFELDLFINSSPSSFIITGQNTVAENQIEVYFVPNNSSVNYKWDIQNGSITDQISNDTAEIQWDTAGKGSIYVIAENQYGCVSDSVTLEVTIGTTGFNTLFNNSDIVIYPNPAKNIIQVDCNEEFSLEIYNFLGEKLIISKRTETNVSNLKTGTYIILIKNKENKLIKINKLVKE